MAAPMIRCARQVALRNFVVNRNVRQRRRSDGGDCGGGAVATAAANATALISKHLPGNVKPGPNAADETRGG